MKIVVIGTRGFPGVQGGIEKHCEELYPRLVTAGCNVTVITRARYTGAQPYTYRGVNMLPLASPAHKFLETLVHTFFAVLKARQINCDILHVHAIGPAFFIPLARLLGLRVVMTHHGPDYERMKWNVLAKTFLRVGEWCGIRFANSIVAVSSTINDHIYQKSGKSAQTIPNGVTIVPRSQKTGTLEKFGLDKCRYILAVGRFVPEKGFNDLLDSFSGLIASEKRLWKLVLVGDADHEDAYSQQLKIRGGWMPQVVMTGFQSGSTLQELYSHASLFIIPSYYEGLPIVLLEALSYGLSCLVSDIPANREVGLDKSRHFSAGNVVEMVALLREFMARPNTEEMQSQRIEHVRERFNWDDAMLKTLAVYENLMIPVVNSVSRDRRVNIEAPSSVPLG